MLPLDFLVEMLEKLAPVVHFEDSKGEDRNIAQFELDNAAQTDLDQYLCFMSVIMADHEKFASVARRSAALQLQQHLNSKDPATLKEQQKHWKTIAADVRDMIKNNVLVALPTISPFCSNVATEIVVSIAVIEVPLKDNWPDLLPTLSYYIRHLKNEEKECAMETLVFVCRHLKAEILAEYFTEIMMVIAGFHMDQLSKKLRLATLNILLACFEFVRPYFENSREGRIIVQAICEAAESADIDIRVTSLELLTRVASSCYQHLKDYIDVIAPITIKAISSEDKDIHRNGLEFWKAVSQVENPRDSEGRLKMGTERSQLTRCFVKKSLRKLVPVLFAELVRGEGFIRAEGLSGNPSVSDSDIYDDEAQPMDYDSFFKTESTLQYDNTSSMTENEQNQNTPNANVNRNLKQKEIETSQNKQFPDWWTPPKEVIIYFSEQCENYPEAIDRYVLPLVQREIRHVEWKHRHAAIWSCLVFLKQMDSRHAENILPPIFSLIRGCVRDTSSSRIRSTALWAISWMVEKCPLLLFISMTSQDLEQLVSDLVTSLNDDEGRVSPSSCTALSSVVKAAYAIAQQKVEESKRPPTFLLSPYYDMMANQLVKAANRRLTAAFDTVGLLLLNAPDDCYWIVLETIDELLLLLRKVIELPDAHHVGCRCHEAVQKLLCGVLRRVLRILKLGETTSNQLCHKFMTYLLSLLNKFPNGLARAEALMSLSTVALLLGWELKHHLDLLVPYLTSAINKTAKKDPVLSLVVDLIGTLFLVLDSEAISLVNKLIGPLLVLTDGNQNLPIEVKIHCVAVFGQIATAVGRPGFQMYMTAVLRRLQHCVQLAIVEEMHGSANIRELRENLRQVCLETYSSLVKSILHRGSLPLTLELCSSSLCLKNIAKLTRSVLTSKGKLPVKTYTAAAHLIGNVTLEFGANKALALTSLEATECKSLLEYVIRQNITNTAVHSICQEALTEIEMAGIGLKCELTLQPRTSSLVKKF